MSTMFNKTIVTLLFVLIFSSICFSEVERARLVPRTNTITNSSTPDINTDTTDIFTITALSANITSMSSNLTGTPVNGQKLIVRILDNGTARNITWGASYAGRTPLPTVTVISKYLYTGLIYNNITSTWDCIASVEE